jgi:hypothetical protein
MASRVFQLCFALVLVHRFSAEEQRSLLTKRITSSQACDDAYDSLKAGDACTTTWSKITKGTHQLRATEPAIGRAWAVAQMGNHFGKKKDSSKWFGKHTFPVVLGGTDFYLTDRHHHAVAIQLTGDEDIWDLDLTLTVVCDLRSYSMDQFWAQMQERNYCLLINRPASTPFALPTAVSADTLPTGWTLSNFTDNMWRSLAGFASHVSDDDSRCYQKPCTFFVDYEWAYTMNYAVQVNQSLWPATASVSAAEFKTTFEKLTYSPTTADAVDLDQWNSVAESVLPFCHSDTIKAFGLPSDLFTEKTLSGWSSVPVPDDPDCPYEVCAAATKKIVV